MTPKFNRRAADNQLTDEQAVQHQHESFQRTRIFYRTSLAILFAALLTALTYIYWTAYPYDPLAFNNTENGKIQVDPSQIKSGGIVFLHVDFCKNIEGGEIINKQLVSDKIVIDLPPKDQLGSTPKGCQKYELPILTPKVSNPGMYHIHFIVEYKVNPVRTVVEEFDTEDFELVN